MSLYPVMLRGSAVRALVVGGGGVAARRIRGLLAAGATVRVVAREYSEQVRDIAPHDRLRLEEPREYEPSVLGDATLVVAATDNAAVNARVTADAISRGCLVNVVDDPGAGTFVTPAVHRADGLVIAVSAAGVPRAAARIRAALARRFDVRYGAAVARLALLRSALLRSGDAGGRARWSDAQRALIDDDFCAAVERGDFDARVAEWV